ncbi:Elongation factor P--(R)-beta-lysine ligase [Roseimaritima ulvae]|uniref:Elongation factor P--(R)-beta-lysine ligase n=2 Tax=Roseimaritima ulvae TaxID=980254 RepID=A0A5B9QR00_9BACT|nr:Elongation factor P--(R)-beta-lysine ligase [Roseimaritima ulvae]
MLQRRARMLKQVRKFFDDRGFIEVQTPCLSADTVVDVHLDPPTLPSRQLDIPAVDLPPELFLQTSPEFAMKRLLVAGATAIYQIAPAFRAGERGPLHNPEFTMLEWYRVGDSAAAAMDLLDEFSQHSLGSQPCRRLSYREAFAQYEGFDPIDAPLPVVKAAAEKWDAALAASLGDDRDALLDVLLSLSLQPRMSAAAPVILSGYPLSQAALAQPSAADPATAERFEWFAQGVELGNGYGELLDADVLAQRAEANNRARQAAGRRPLPVGSQLEAAMRQGLPACSGVAVGFDRLLMVATAARRIDEVQTFPIERA